MRLIMVSYFELGAAANPKIRRVKKVRRNSLAFIGVFSDAFSPISLHALFLAIDCACVVADSSRNLVL